MSARSATSARPLALRRCRVSTSVTAAVRVTLKNGSSNRVRTAGTLRVVSGFGPDDMRRRAPRGGCQEDHDEVRTVCSACRGKDGIQRQKWQVAHAS